MSGIVSNKRIMVCLTDEQDRCYYVEKSTGKVKWQTLPVWLENNPESYRSIDLQWGTNAKYFSTIRDFSGAITFSGDGLAIIMDRLVNGIGIEEKIYVVFLVRNSFALNGFKLEYKSRLDLSKATGDIHKGITVNTLQEDVFAWVQANETVNYNIPCNASNPAAIKILYDGLPLQDKINYNPFDIQITPNPVNHAYAIPMTIINNEGDSVGVIFNDSNFDNFADVDTYTHNPTNSNNVLEFDRTTTVTFKGEYKFNATFDPSHGYDATVGFIKSTQTFAGTGFPRPQLIFTNTTAGGNPHFNLISGHIYSTGVNMPIVMHPGEKLFAIMILSGNGSNNQKFNQMSSTLSALFTTSQIPTIAYALRPLDALKQLVSLITNGLFTADSKFFANNNRKVMLSGSSLRNFSDAAIITNFSDWFKSYDACYNLGVTVRNGVLWVEPLTSIYNNSKQVYDFDEISKVKPSIATEFIYTSAKFGYTKQTYNKRNGRYEYNCTHNYKFAINSVINKLEKISPYRADSFGKEFIRTGYSNLNTTDDKGDGDVFTEMISDEIGQTDGAVNTFISVTVATLVVVNPVITSPVNNAIIYNDHPTILGKSQPNIIITVYVNGFVDGTTVSDSIGNWSYLIQTALQPLDLNNNGVHAIEATATSSGGVNSSFSNVLTLVIDTGNATPLLITAPGQNDILYNNLPVIRGTAPSGLLVSIQLDGAPYANVTPNTSGIWSYQVIAPLSDGVHSISVSAIGQVSPTPLSITINKNVATPLITSLVYGDIIYNNLPLIKGVAIPATTVSVYLDAGGGPVTGGTAAPLGTTVADANGDWSFQVTIVYDPSGNLLPAVPDGQHFFSTTATPVDVQAAITGYRLMRGSNKGPVMDYDYIKLDDTYIPTGVDPSTLPPTLGQYLNPQSLYGIEETTPLRMLLAHYAILSPFLQQQPNAFIKFNGAEGNPNLVTKKNGIVYNEGANVQNNTLGASIYHPWYISFEGPVKDTFADMMESINNDGYIRTQCKGVEIFVLPIGNMKKKLAAETMQQMKMLVSSKTPLANLIKIFGKGEFLNLGTNMIWISDKNPIHIVRYNKVLGPKYHFADIYDDWMKNRYSKWLMQPYYAQPVQTTDDPLPLQIITNGVGVLQAQVISVYSGTVIDSINFAPVTTPMITTPNVLMQCVINPSDYAAGKYWIGVFADGALVGVSEMIDLQTDHDNTMLYQYDGSEDQIDYFFSTGIKPYIRVESVFMPLDADSEVDIYENETGSYNITRGIAVDNRKLQWGSKSSLIPDWMRRKMNQITLLSNWRVDTYKYTRNENSKVESDDLGKGINMFICKILVVPALNEQGVHISTPGDSGIHPVAYVIQATAFGRSGVFNVTALEQ